MSVSSDSTHKQKSEEGWLETVKVIIHALLIALVIRTFLFQPFTIPSGSMKSTLLVGDFLFVSKYSYGYSQYSFPFAPPLFSGRVWASEPKRGDVVVFRHPRDNSMDYVKRVIGLPGDRIQVVDGVLHINGTAVQEERIGSYYDRAEGGELTQYRETLPNGVSHIILKRDFIQSNSGQYTVPEGHYFMMGDNRDNSQDSRSPAVGFVPFDKIIGRAEIIFFSVDKTDPNAPIWGTTWSVRWDRLFDRIR